MIHCSCIPAIHIPPRCFYLVKQVKVQAFDLLPRIWRAIQNPLEFLMLLFSSRPKQGAYQEELIDLSTLHKEFQKQSQDPPLIHSTKKASPALPEFKPIPPHCSKEAYELGDYLFRHFLKKKRIPENHLEPLVEAALSRAGQRSSSQELKMRLRESLKPELRWLKNLERIALLHITHYSYQKPEHFAQTLAYLRTCEIHYASSRCTRHLISLEKKIKTHEDHFNALMAFEVKKMKGAVAKKLAAIVAQGESSSAA